jgi:hypothetical protein
VALRIAFDLDGTLADFETSYKEIESRLFGAGFVEPGTPVPETRAASEEAAGVREPEDQPKVAVRTSAHRDRVWREIQSTPDYWASLLPIDPSVIPRIQEMATRHRWEVMFITQRPSTAGETVQRQTQRWLMRQGFEMPSVMVLRGSRGKVAESLHLDYVVDDSVQNCVDVVSESKAKAILVLRYERDDEGRPQRAKQLGIEVIRTIGACLDFLEQIETTKANPSLLQRMAKMVGLRKGQ